MSSFLHSFPWNGHAMFTYVVATFLSWFMYFLPFELWRWWLIDYNDNKNYFSVQVGDYWVIYLLSKNLNPIAMKELLEELKPVKQKNKKNNDIWWSPGDGACHEHLQAGLPWDGREGVPHVGEGVPHVGFQDGVRGRENEWETFSVLKGEDIFRESEIL